MKTFHKLAVISILLSLIFTSLVFARSGGSGPGYQDFWRKITGQNAITPNNNYDIGDNLHRPDIFADDIDANNLVIGGITTGNLTVSGSSPSYITGDGTESYFGDDLEIRGGDLKVDRITEYTTDHGVDVETVHMEDGDMRIPNGKQYAAYMLAGGWGTIGKIDTNDDTLLGYYNNLILRAGLGQKAKIGEDKTEFNHLKEDQDFAIYGSGTILPVVYVDGETGNIGINTNTPNAALDVAGDIVSLGLTVFGDVEIGDGYSGTGITIEESGNLLMSGKLTVDGAIDPTMLVLTPQGAAPGTDNGTTYYDTTNGFQFREAGVWVDLSNLESFWQRAGTELSPKTAGDDLLLNTGETLSISDMTTGSIPFIGSGGLFTQDNSNLFWHSANSRLGINTSIPKTSLHVANIDGITLGDGNDTDQDLIIVDVTGTPKLWWDEATDSFETNKTLTLPINNITLNNNEYIDIDTSHGWGFVLLGDTEEWARFVWKDDGSVTSIYNSANVSLSDTGVTLAIFDNGTHVRIKNRLGSSKNIKYNLQY